AAQLFARPKRHASPVADRFDIDDVIRISETDAGWLTEVSSLFENGVVQEALQLRRFQYAFQPAPIEADVKGAADETRRPLEHDLARTLLELLDRFEVENSLRRQQARNVVQQVFPFGDELRELVDEACNVRHAHDQHIEKRGPLHIAELAQRTFGFTAPHRVVNRHNDVP